MTTAATETTSPGPDFTDPTERARWSRIEHLVLHLAKDTGLLAAAVEKVGHHEERAEGARLFGEWMERRAPNIERTLRLLRDEAGA